MAIKNKEISKRLENEIRALSFSSNEKFADETDVHIDEPIVTPVLETVTESVPKKTPTTPLSLNKRIVTLEYLDKFEQATIASTRYESIKEFSHILSNLSIVLLTISIITYLVFYFINPQGISLISLLLLSFEAFALLSITLYSISKTATFKQISDIAASDFSTCSHVIGNPRGEIYTPLESSDIPNV